MRFVVPALLTVLASHVVSGQTVTHIYVTSGNKSDDAWREEAITLLKNQKAVSVVDNQSGADRVLVGTCQTYIKGYLSRNPRVRYRNSDSRPVYGGYLSVELKDPMDDTVWSYLVTPSRFGPEDVNKNLADQIVNKLLEFLAKTP